MDREAKAGRAVAFVAGTAIGLLGLTAATEQASAAEQAAIRNAVSRASAFLRASAANTGSGQQVLIAYALLKAGLPPNSPEITAAVDMIRGRVANGEYTAGTYHHYEAGISAMLLVEVGGEPEGGEPHPYLAELQAIANYVEGLQLPNGSWDYPPPDARVTNGDTSVVQYALLALWAAKRGGAKVTPTVWQNAIQWHIANRRRTAVLRTSPARNTGSARARPC